MANILLISETKNFMVSSVMQQLEYLNHNVTYMYNETMDLANYLGELDLVLIYVEKQVVNEVARLKDKIVDGNVPVFVIGDADKIPEVETVIPKEQIKKKYIRPVNVKDVVGKIDKYLRKEEERPVKTILVVDDSGAMLRNVKGWLEEKYEVILANSGAMAIKYLAMNRPDLVLLDYEMPVCNGKQVLEMIRSEAEYVDVAVIFLTTKCDRESVMNVTSLKPDGYLLKSMEPEKIVEAIDDFFEKRRWDL